MTAAPSTSRPARSARVAFEADVEAVRGISVLLVAACHLLSVGVIDATWMPPEPWCHLGSGHGGVLLFFVLSGYVIGLTNPAPWALGDGRDYVERRLVRLAPAYLLVVLAVAAAGQAESLRQFFAHLLALFLALLAPALWRWRPPLRQGFLVFMGGISYVFYLVHYPLLFVIRNSPLPHGGPAAFLLRGVVWFGLTVAVAWVFERRVQPRLRQAWRSRREAARV